MHPHGLPAWDCPDWETNTAVNSKPKPPLSPATWEEELFSSDPDTALARVRNEMRHRSQQLEIEQERLMRRTKERNRAQTITLIVLTAGAIVNWFLVFMRLKCLL